MTRLLFLPDENTLILLNSPMKPDELVDSVEKNLWNPPAPYHETSHQRLQAVKLGTVVLISEAPRQKTHQARRRMGVNLTRRQMQVLQGLAEGLTTHQIAVRLKLHRRTVDFHVNALKTRLGASNRSESVSLASALGYINPKENK